MPRAVRQSLLLLVVQLQRGESMCLALSLSHLSLYVSVFCYQCKYWHNCYILVSNAAYKALFFNYSIFIPQSIIFILFILSIANI